MRTHRFQTGLVVAVVHFAAPSIFAGTLCPILGDLDQNNSVNAADLAMLLGLWNTANGDADLNVDGIVNAADLALLLGGWGEAGFACGVFPTMWINGGSCLSEPFIQVHQYNSNTYILRQSLCTNFEGPFMYLLFGEDRVLLEDTGAGGISIGPAVYAIINQWLIDHDKTTIQLVVAHSHAHGDHVAGDAQFSGQPNTTVVGLSQASVASFFGIANWPTQIVQYDLGGRILDVIPIPGHHPAHIAFYDRQTRLLLTGDTLYPGRLYISDFAAYTSSIARLVNFAAANPIVWIMGTHIEMSNVPGEQFAFGSTFHPNEHPLQLSPPVLDELHQAILAMQANPHIETHDEFVIWPF